MRIRQRLPGLVWLAAGLLLAVIAWAIAEPLIQLKMRGVQTTAQIAAVLSHECSTKRKQRTEIYECFEAIYAWTYEGVSYRDAARSSERSSDRPVLGTETPIEFIPTLPAEAGAPTRKQPAIQPELMMLADHTGRWITSTLIASVGLVLVLVGLRTLINPPQRKIHRFRRR